MSLEQLVRDPQGRLSEAKVWSNVYKAGMFYILMTHTEKLLLDWALLGLVLAAGIAPDLLKKMISAKAGISETPK